MTHPWTYRSTHRGILIKLLEYTHEHVIKLRSHKMADTLKDELLLGGGNRHLTATSQYHAHSKQVPACVLFKCVNFRQYVVCLRERIFNCWNVLTSSWSWTSRSNNKQLSPEVLLIYGRHFWLLSECGTSCCTCGCCGSTTFSVFF